MSGPSIQPDGAAIRQYRERKNLTQQNLADRVGLKNVKQMGLIERGKSGTKKETLDKIAEVLEVSVNQLLPPITREPSPFEGKGARILPSWGITEQLFGRETDLSDIKEQMGIDGDPEKASDLQFVTTVGFPGVGKSAIALALSEDDDIKAVFPHGVLWLEFGNWRESKSRQRLHLMLEKLATGLTGESVLGIPGLDQAANKISRLLENQQLLLVLDDVWSSSQVDLFLNIIPKQSSLLVTTPLKSVADEVSFTRGSSYELGELSQKSARAMLLDLVQRNGISELDSCEKILAYTGNIPGAIIIAAKLLVKTLQRGASHEHLVSRLADSSFLESEAVRIRQKYDSAPAKVIQLLNGVTGTMTDEQKQMFSSLHWMQQSPTVEYFDLKTMWEDDTEEMIDCLIDLGLIRSTEHKSKRAFLINHLVYRHAANFTSEQSLESEQ